MPEAFTQVPPPFPLAGEIASLTAAFLWAWAITAYRHWGSTVPPHTLNLFKSTVATTCLGVTLVLLRPPGPASPYVCAKLALSGVVGLALGDTAFFAALRRLGAQATSSVVCLSPPLTAILAAYLLREQLTVRETAGMILTVLAVGGVLYFGRKGSSPIASLPLRTVLLGVLYALVGSLATAFGIVIAREALQKSDLVWGTFLRLAPAGATLVGIRYLDRPTRPLREVFLGRRQIAALFAASFCGTFVGILLLSAGTKYAKAGVVSALSSTFPLWVIPIARIYLHERTGPAAVFCTLIAIAGICLLLLPGGAFRELLGAAQRLLP